MQALQGACRCDLPDTRVGAQTPAIGRRKHSPAPALAFSFRDSGRVADCEGGQTSWLVRVGGLLAFLDLSQWFLRAFTSSNEAVDIGGCDGRFVISFCSDEICKGRLRFGLAEYGSLHTYLHFGDLVTPIGKV